MTQDIARSLLKPTSDIVASFVGRHPVSASELAILVRTVHDALQQIGSSEPEPALPERPAVPIRKSIQDDYLVCLNDGRRLKSLKRHLRSRYGMTPDDYRAKWDLPADYPMVAPGYARERSAMAKAMGLGMHRRKG